MIKNLDLSKKTDKLYSSFVKAHDFISNRKLSLNEKEGLKAIAYSLIFKWDYEKPSLLSKASDILFHILKKHKLYDENKRTALISMLFYLLDHKVYIYSVLFNWDDYVVEVIKNTNSEKEVQKEIMNILEDNSYKVKVYKKDYKTFISKDYTMMQNIKRLANK